MIPLVRETMGCYDDSVLFAPGFYLLRPLEPPSMTNFLHHLSRPHLPPFRASYFKSILYSLEMRNDRVGGIRIWIISLNMETSKTKVPRPRHLLCASLTPPFPLQSLSRISYRRGL
jgi:hypothetical protein